MDTDGEHDPAVSSGWLGRALRYLPHACIALSTLGTLSWVVAAWLMTTRGFDITDEGFYVLSYRWWSSNLHSFTGTQYIYGPIFDALGHNVAALRVFRLGSVLAVSILFAVAFMNWLAAQEPRVRPLRWKLAGISSLVASGGMIYAWLPQTPGYDDVAALGALAMAAVLLSTARRCLQHRRVPAWLPFVGGVLCVLQLLAKWPSILGVGVYGIAILLVFRGSGRRNLARHAALVLAGGVASSALVHLFVIPLDRAMPEIWFVIQSAIDESGSTSSRAMNYVSESLTVTTVALVLGAPLVAVAVASRVGRSRQVTAASTAATFTAFGLFWAMAVLIRGWQGGHSNTFRYTVTLLALLVALVVANVRVHRPSSTAIGPLLMLVLLPVTQAFGTANPIWLVGANAFAAWFAVIIWLVVTSTPNPRTGLFVSLSATSVIVLVPVIVCTGLLAHPYRTSDFASNTAVAPGMRSIRVSPATAREFQGIRDALRVHGGSKPIPVLALDRMSGLIFIAGDTAAGETWTGVDSRARSAAVLERACRQGEIGPNRPPALLYNRPPAATDIDALAACGFTFPGDFIEIRPKNVPAEIRVFVPK